MTSPRVREIMLDTSALANLAHARIHAGATPLPRLIRSEIAGDPPSGTPVLCQSGLSHLFASLDDPAAFERWRAGELERWERSTAPGRRIPDANRRRAEWWKRLPQRERARRRTKMGANRIDTDIVGSEHDLVFEILAHDIDEPFASMAKEAPLRYRAHLTRAGLLALHLLAVPMHGEHTPEFPWLRIAADDWNDLTIAAGAAYSDLFLTDDNGLRERLSFLRSRGYVSFDALSTRDFLASAAG